ncbi:MAG: portal protein [Leptospiraceae bacterium]|nr:portal protein [Leptospiraceae bacterium]MCK6382223.1 portal protein [Leptospiraceae bacterium]NUM41616.1 portal protein [Leptospiraceae bacterium]
MKYRKVKIQFLYFLESINDFGKRIRILYHENLYGLGKFVFALSGTISIATLLIEFGFYYPVEWAPKIRFINSFAINYLLAYETISFLFTRERYRIYAKTHKIEIIISILVLLQKVFEKDIIEYLKLGEIGTNEAALLFLSINQLFLIFSNATRFFRSTRIYSLNRINPSLVFLLSFAFVILVGFSALHLPKAQKVSVRSIDILFTVVSATCVTGLSTLDISQSFTKFGQFIILFLIQIGGLGLMTLTTFFAIFLAGQSSVTDRLLMKDLLSEDALGKVTGIIRQVAIQTLAIEGIGAALLFRYMPVEANLTFSEKLFSAIFHAISAFCNAGFSLFSNNMGESFLFSNKPFLSVIMFLIVMGGLGFPVMSEVIKRFISPNNPYKRLSISSKLVIITTGVLIALGAIAYLSLEQKFTLQNLNIQDRVFHSLFYSISTRTAGFNTLSLSSMGVPMVFFSLFLMWVGASPNSTGGGIKTSTFAVALLHILDLVKGKDRLEIFKRTISPASISRASASIVLSFFIIFVAIFALILNEKFEFLDISYEVVSAFGTVGLTRGITPSLSDFGKIIISVVMFSGRVGIFTMFVAFTPKAKIPKYKYPIEYVVVG